MLTGQIRIKRRSHLQIEVSHDRNRFSVPEPVLEPLEPFFGSGHVAPHFARANAALSEFDL